MLIKDKVLLESKAVQKPENIVSEMDGEKVMLNIKNGKYYNLGELGGAIWDLLKEPIQIQSLIKVLLSEYEVEHCDCEQQVINFLASLKAEGLIIINN